jgi:hypothetical protein
MLLTSSVAARSVDRARHFGCDLTLAGAERVRVGGGDVDHHRDRPLLACRLQRTSRDAFGTVLLAEDAEEYEL